MLPQVAAAQEKTPSRQELRSLEQQLEQARKREKVIQGDLTAVEAEAADISAKLVDLAARVQAREGQIAAAEVRIGELDLKKTNLENSLGKKRNAMAELLIGLQRLERNPPPPLAAHPGDARDAIRAATLFGAIVPALKAQSTAIRRNLSELKNLRAALVHEREELKKRKAELAGTRVELAGLLARKKEIVATTRKGLDQERTRMAELAKKARNLRQLMEKIVKERELAEKRRKEKLAREEFERQERLRRPRIAFSKSRGRLAFPAQGRQVTKFNEKNALGRVSKGVYLVTRASAQVITPADGTVEFAGPFRSYGQLLILNVGEKYHILLAGMGRIDVETGQSLRAGEPVGVMGKEPARGTLITAAMAQSRPVLYIEFRKNNGPVNPAPWWLGNQKEARN